MKAVSLFIVIALLSVSSLQAQVAFEKGYFIDNTGKKIECQIKNLGWKYNPKEIEYITSDNSNPTTISINDMQEFGIDGVSKYVRKTVDIDVSSDNINNLSKQKAPDFQVCTLDLFSLSYSGIDRLC